MKRGSWLHRWAWAGLWAATFALFAVIGPWAISFHVTSTSRFPSPGSLRFLLIILGPALIASLFTISVWSRRYTMAASMRSRRLTLRDRLVAVVCVCVLMALAIFQIVGIRHVSPFWPGVIGGAIAIPLLFIAAIRCASVAIEATKRTLHDQPPGYQIAPAKKAPVHRFAPADMAAFEETPWRRPPTNWFRAHATASEVVYRRPVRMRMFGYVFGPLMGALAIACLYFAGGDLGVYEIPTLPPNPTVGFLLAGGALFAGAAVAGCWMLASPQELRISLPEQTYTLMSPAALPRRIAGGLTVLYKSDRAAIGIPWRMERRSGPRRDIAGVAMQKFETNAGSHYAIWLLWQSPYAAPIRLAWESREDRARHFLRQASDDLGVPVLPHLPVVHDSATPI